MKQYIVFIIDDTIMHGCITYNSLNNKSNGFVKEIYEDTLLISYEIYVGRFTYNTFMGWMNRYHWFS